MKNQFTNKMLTRHLEQCHTSAMAFIEIITNAAIGQIEIERMNVMPEDMTPELIGRYAAKSLGMEAEQLINDYTSMMVLEGMVEIVKEIHHYPEGG